MHPIYGCSRCCPGASWEVASDYKMVARRFCLETMFRVWNFAFRKIKFLPKLRVQDGFGGLKMDCKYCQDEVCVNADCPMCADFCPVVDYPGVCRFEEREERNEQS